MPGEDSSDFAEGSGAHKVVVAHEEAVFAGSLLDEAADVGVVPEVNLVLVIAERSGIALGIFAGDGSDLRAFAGRVFAKNYLEVAPILRIDGVKQRRQMTSAV